MDFKAIMLTSQKLVENYLKNRIAKKGISKVDEAMEYSLMAGGKRIRPILLMAAAEAVGSKGYNYLPVACGLEMIHTYSLIHDDLPCMDDDDYRRGRLTNHKVFGEAMAVLAGDGLLTLAFEVMLEQKNVDPKVLIETVREMAMCAGNFGMVGGQGLDLEFEAKRLRRRSCANCMRARPVRFLLLLSAAVRIWPVLMTNSSWHSPNLLICWDLPSRLPMISLMSKALRRSLASRWAAMPRTTNLLM